MKVILIIITVMALVIGASINSLAVTLEEQMYSAMFYIMALMAFCTFALIFRGRAGGKWKCDWLMKECGLETETESDKDTVRRDVPAEEEDDILVFEEDDLDDEPRRNKNRNR